MSGAAGVLDKTTNDPFSFGKVARGNSGDDI